MNSTNDVPGSLFQGYNLITPSVKNTCVTGDFTESAAPGNSELTICKGYSSLASAMQIDVSVSVGVAGFGGANSKYSYFHSLNITETSITILLRTSLVNRKLQVSNVKLLEDEKPNVINAIQSKKFVSKYGDSYVSYIELGGEYIAAYVFHAQTKEEMENIEDKIKANFTEGTLSADASFSQKINTVCSSCSSRMQLTQYMSLVGHDYPSFDGICDFALTYPTLAANDNTVLNWSTTGYNDADINELAEALDAVTNNRNYLLGVPGVGLIGKLTELQTLITNKAHADEVLKIYRYYNENFSDSNLNINVALIKKDIDNIRKQLVSYFLDPTKELESIELPSLDLGYPKLNLIFSQVKLGSQNNGDYAEDINDLSAFIRKCSKITEITLHGDSNIVGIATVYNIDGKEVTKQNGEMSEYTSVLELGGDDYYPLTSYQASEWGGNLKNLCITANGKTINMGIVEGRASTGTQTPQDGNFLVSLGARHWGSDNIVSVCFNFAKFAPAKWVTPD